MQTNDKATMVVFSGDLDKAMASFIIATGAAAMGKEVTMFFTFWGLNILRKEELVPTKKSFLENLFGKMMPRGPEKLGVSKMNFGGLGAKMMKKIMQEKNIATLKELIEMAQDLGVKMVACQMSMDVLGLTEAEMVDGLDYAGVATYLAEADQGNVNLFI